MMLKAFVVSGITPHQAMVHKFTGHSDQISSIVCIENTGRYVTTSWDRCCCSTGQLNCSSHADFCITPLPLAVGATSAPDTVLYRSICVWASVGRGSGVSASNAHPSILSAKHSAAAAPDEISDYEVTVLHCNHPKTKFAFR